MIIFIITHDHHLHHHYHHHHHHQYHHHYHHHHYHHHHHNHHYHHHHAGTIGDMQQLGIRESYKSKLQVLVSAAEAAEMILRVDDIIKCAPRQRQ
jgi:chaperonin GroEL (HSP60 family)